MWRRPPAGHDRVMNESMHKSTENSTQSGGAAPAPRRLRRARSNRMVAGVCAGAADFLGVDVNIVRLGLAVFTLFGGAGLAAYALGWLLIPEEGADKSIAQDTINKYVERPKT